MALCFPICFPACFKIVEKYPFRVIVEERGKYTTEDVESKYFTKEEKRGKYTVEEGD